MSARPEILSELIGGAYPNAIDAGGGRLRRNFVARTVDVLSGQPRLDEIAEALGRWACETITTAYSKGSTTEAISRSCPSVELVRLDDHHVIVRIEFAGPDIAVGDSAMIAQWGVLQRLDREIRLDDLQGIPCAHWRLLRGGA